MRTIAIRSILVLSSALALACSSDDGGDDEAADDEAGDTAGESAGEDSDESAGESAGDSSGGEPAMPRLPDVMGVQFVDVIDNPYLPMPVGATWVSEAVTEEGTEHIEVEVTTDTREIEGVTATVVRDTVTLDGVVIEDTWDWFAQDADGNVWYLGEDTCEFEDGMCVNTVGAWEWGVDGALPGIVMPAAPALGEEPFYQEYYIGEAEDFAEIIEMGLSVTVPAGTFEDCIKTRERSTLDLTLNEFKYYCPGVGNVLVEEEDVREELMEYHQP